MNTLSKISLLITLFIWMSSVFAQMELLPDEFDYLHRGNNGYVSSNGLWSWKGKVIDDMDNTRFSHQNFTEAIRNLRLDSNEIYEFVHQYHAVNPVNGLASIKMALKLEDAPLDGDNTFVKRNAMINEAIEHYQKSWWFRGKNWGNLNNSPQVVLKIVSANEASRFISWYVNKVPDGWEKLAKTWDDYRFELPDNTRRELYDRLRNSGSCNFYLTNAWARH